MKHWLILAGALGMGSFCGACFADEVVANAVAHLDLAAERQRIMAQRTQQEALFQRRRDACYQRFAVNYCLLAAKRARRTVIDELRSREILLNELDRQTQAIDALSRIQGNVSPERQQQAADQAAQAEQDTLARQNRSDEKNAVHSAPEAPRNQTQLPKVLAAPSNAAANERAFAAKLAQAKQRKLDLENRLKQQGKSAIGLPLPN